MNGRIDGELRITGVGAAWSVTWAVIGSRTWPTSPQFFGVAVRRQAAQCGRSPRAAAEAQRRRKIEPRSYC